MLAKKVSSNQGIGETLIVAKWYRKNSKIKANKKYLLALVILEKINPMFLISAIPLL
ncbi:hypothetical protein CLV24_12636 [Pontibacter ummariensis]|uniref:Uncharacterized protein n=1 Tax=Pontibacter ummariensis TaxID=1610492 RepID=A0A239K3M5_9BACT|nr:hypothetical protein CLV24_12636 [Pontibacter ummariensis]SNT12996.1 hypothetical protein SAMN06296052_12617 [Pontibacter ummariensis]